MREKCIFVIAPNYKQRKAKYQVSHYSYNDAQISDMNDMYDN